MAEYIRPLLVLLAAALARMGRYVSALGYNPLEGPSFTEKNATANVEGWKPTVGLTRAVNRRACSTMNTATIPFHTEPLSPIP